MVRLGYSPDDYDRETFWGNIVNSFPDVSATPGVLGAYACVVHLLVCMGASVEICERVYLPTFERMR